MSPGVRRPEDLQIPWPDRRVPSASGDGGQLEGDDIARIKVLHRPNVRWRNCEVFAGCSCGTPYHPSCDKLLVALEVERQMNASARNVDPRYRRP